jgi:hypothetical protein
MGHKAWGVAYCGDEHEEKENRKGLGAQYSKIEN